MNYRSQKSAGLRSFAHNLKLDRNLVFLGLLGVLTVIILFRLFSLQVLAYEHYSKIATQAHYGYSELPAHRGEIFIKDYASGENVRIATNSTLDLLFADPTLIKNKKTGYRSHRPTDLQSRRKSHGRQ
jgi:cell division protein FtsI/penicillin-binding protein 2